MATVKKCAARLLHLVVVLYAVTLCLVIIPAMLFVAFWMMRIQPAVTKYLPSNPVRLMRTKDIGTLPLLLLVALVVTFLWFGFHFGSDQEPTPSFTQVPSAPHG